MSHNLDSQAWIELQHLKKSKWRTWVVFVAGLSDKVVLCSGVRQSVKELLPELRNRFGKSLAPASNNNNGSNKGPGSKPKTFKHQGGRQGTGSQGRKCE
jgi:hypothetical protein